MLREYLCLCRFATAVVATRLVLASSLNTIGKKAVTIMRIGTTKKYAQNWGSAFGQKLSAKGAKKSAPASPKKTPKKKPPRAKSK